MTCDTGTRQLLPSSLQRAFHAISHPLIHTHNKGGVAAATVLLGDGVPDGVVKGEAAAADLLEERRLALVVEGRVAAQQDEEHHARAPQVHRRVVHLARGALQGGQG